MSAPDHISPVVAYRLWQWDVSGLKSLNGVLWVTGQALAAQCRATMRRRAVEGLAQSDHDAPLTDCRCGVYGSKRLDSLQRMCFWESGVRGEVLLWGTVVEHEHGWRAQYAYPKTLFLPSEALPITLAEIQSRLQSLVPYRCDIFVAHDGGSVPIWRKDSGLHPAGLDFLMTRSKQWYAQRRHQRSLKAGDRIAVGRGIAIVEHAEAHWVHALWNRGKLLLLRKDIAWDDVNSRWELNGSA